MSVKLDPERIVAEVIAAGEEWADRESAARHLEEAKASVRAEIATRWMDDGATAAKADAKALAAPDYIAHITAMVEARRKANLARVLYDGMKLKVELMRTQAATLRAEMKL